MGLCTIKVVQIVFEHPWDSENISMLPCHNAGRSILLMVPKTDPCTNQFCAVSVVFDSVPLLVSIRILW